MALIFAHQNHSEPPRQARNLLETTIRSAPGNYHKAVRARIAQPMLVTNVPYRSSGFDCFQDRDDLMFTEFALLHFGLLASYSPGNLYFSMALFLGRVTESIRNG
jgi:hypothetical protein